MDKPEESQYVPSDDSPAPGRTVDAGDAVLRLTAALATATATLGAPAAGAETERAIPALDRAELKSLARDTGLTLPIRTHKGAIVDALQNAEPRTDSDLRAQNYSKVHDRAGGHDKVSGYTMRNQPTESEQILENWRGDVFVSEISPEELKRLRDMKLNVVSGEDVELIRKFTAK